jgi:hypothetical protein
VPPVACQTLATGGFFVSWNVPLRILPDVRFVIKVV